MGHYAFRLQFFYKIPTRQQNWSSRCIVQTQIKKVPEDRVIAAISVEPEVILGLVSTVRALSVTSEMIKEPTAADPILQEVLHFHSTSWPNICTDQKLQPFFQWRSSLSKTNRILHFAEHIVVPVKLQNRVLKQFHDGHQGINQMKAFACGYVYWPNMDKQLEELVKSCTKCQLVAKSPQKTKLYSWPIPESPWSWLHIDFADQ